MQDGRMSKRGITKPYKVEYEWSPSGISGVVPCSTYDDAELKAAQIRRGGEYRDDAEVVVEIHYRPAGSTRRIKQ